MGEYNISLFFAAPAPLLLGIAVLVAQQLISGLRDPLRDDPVNLILTTTGWVLIATGIVAPLFGLLGFLIILMCVIGVFVLIEAWRKGRASQQNALLWLLVIAAERFMPLAPAIEAFARERRGLFAWRARRLAELLAAGAPLADALALCPKLLPRYALPMVRVGCQSGALAPALRKAATVHNQHATVWMSLIGKVSYVLLLPAFGLVVLVFATGWLFPRYQSIFKEFHTQLPPVTQWLFQANVFFINYWFLFSPLLILYLWLVVHLVMRYFGLTQSDFPLMGSITRRLDSANILDALALTARRQRPMGEGIAELARSYPKRKIRRQLARVFYDIEAGRDWADSLCGRSLIGRADLALLKAAQRVGNLSWAMQEAADSARRRFIYRLQAITQAVFPAAVICFGVVVMFIVVALFLPLVTLIQRMA
jgi:type II secretory pathway component PulF